MKAQHVLAYLALSIVSLAAAGTQTSAVANDEDFYKGKQLTLIVAGAAGGAYDSYSRLLTQSMPEHLPGRPTIIVQNMPGAGGIRAANYMYKVAAKDGTAFAGVSSAIPVGPLTAPKAAEYDANKMQWLGSISHDTRVGLVWHTAPIKTLEDAKTTTVSMGGTAVGTGSVDMVIIANELFGFKFKLVTGYKGSPEAKLAVERGELDGIFGNQLGDVKSTKPEWIKENKIRMITQFGFKKHPELPDVPLFIDQAKTQEERQILEFLLARQEAAFPYLAPPEVPAARVTLLRRAFDRTMTDAKFLAGIEKAKLVVDGPMTGEELAALTAKLSATPVAVVHKVNAVFEKYRSSK